MRTFWVLVLQITWMNFAWVIVLHCYMLPNNCLGFHQIGIEACQKETSLDNSLLRLILTQFCGATYYNTKYSVVPPTLMRSIIFTVYLSKQTFKKVFLLSKLSFNIFLRITWSFSSFSSSSVFSFVTICIEAKLYRLCLGKGYLQFVTRVTSTDNIYIIIIDKNIHD